MLIVSNWPREKDGMMLMVRMGDGQSAGGKGVGFFALPFLPRFSRLISSWLFTQRALFRAEFKRNHTICPTSFCDVPNCRMALNTSF